MAANRLRVIFAGAGEFGLPALRAVVAAGHEVARVFTQPDRPAGRGRKLTPTPIGRYAMDERLPLARTADINQEPLPPADAMVVIAFGQKISQTAANHPRLGSVNLHSSRLPKFRGAAPINWAILSGEKETGNSVIRLAERMDAGAVLGMSLVTIGKLETAGELHDRLAEDGAGLMLRVLDELAAGTAKEIAQDESRASRALKLNRESTKIDWNEPAERIARQIRGMHPWPGCRARLVGTSGEELNRLTLVRARLNDETNGRPGIVQAGGMIACGAGSVEVIEVQPEGKRAMALAAYQNGHKWEAGTRVESIA